MKISAETSLGRIAAQHPLATRVFSRHRLDFCCGGERSLAEACAAKGLASEAVLEEIRAEVGRESPASGATRNWDTAHPREVIEHIIAAYHDPLREELPRLAGMARKVAAVHGSLRPDSLPELSEVVTALREELEVHMEEEERDVFPRLLDATAGSTEFVEDRLADLEHDHAEAGETLRRIRELTGDYEVPAEACGTWRALWGGLEELERTMHEHVHLENHVLFARARRQPPG